MRLALYIFGSILVISIGAYFYFRQRDNLSSRSATRTPDNPRRDFRKEFVAEPQEEQPTQEEEVKKSTRTQEEQPTQEEVKHETQEERSQEEVKLKLKKNSQPKMKKNEKTLVIDEGKFKHKTIHHKWSDTLSDDGKKIIYHEYTYDTDQCIDFENWVHINKKGLDKAAFKWFCTYLKAFKRKDRLEKLKRFLNDKKISFEEGDLANN